MGSNLIVMNVAAFNKARPLIFNEDGSFQSHILNIRSDPSSPYYVSVSPPDAQAFKELLRDEKIPFES